jgi:hypothetical protein
MNTIKEYKGIKEGKDYIPYYPESKHVHYKVYDVQRPNGSIVEVGIPLMSSLTIEELIKDNL